MPNIEVSEMFKVEIHCPFHGVFETLELPDSYKDFEGEVVCPTSLINKNTGANLRIKIRDQKLLELERAT